VTAVEMFQPVPTRTRSADRATVEAVKAELLARNAQVTHHGRWSLYAHLVETFNLLERWEQPAGVCLAGLVHSVYSTDIFTERLFGFEERSKVRDLIGEEAERLAFLFCSIDRRDLFRSLGMRHAGDRTPLVAAGRAGEAECELSASQIGSLLAIYMANEVEQSAGPDGGPAPWIAHVSRLGLWAREYSDAPPPVFDGGTAHVGRDDERALLDAYAAAVCAGPEARADSVERLGIAAERVPWIGEPWILLALAALSEGDAERAAALCARGTDSLETFGTPWDKRLSMSRWTRLAQFVTGAACAGDAARRFAAKRTGMVLKDVGLLPSRIDAHLESIGAFEDAPSKPSADAVPPRFVRYVAGFRGNQEHPRMTRYPGLEARPFHETSRFPLARELERHSRAIIEELRGIDAGLFHRESENIGRTGDWDVFMLFERGRHRRENSARCPLTTSIVSSNRAVRTLAGLIYVSRLAPHSRVAPHFGPTNMRLRCHLGISVPRDCGLSVGGVVTRWEEGRCVVFDDSFEHFVWNDSDEERIVLIADLWHPDLGNREVELLEGFHRYAAAHGENLATYWNNNLTARQRVAMME
jgi:Aspartyl/Asparaginyl beta-hydroxylase